MTDRGKAIAAGIDIFREDTGTIGQKFELLYVPKQNIDAGGEKFKSSHLDIINVYSFRAMLQVEEFDETTTLFFRTNLLLSFNEANYRVIYKSESKSCDHDLLTT